MTILVFLDEVPPLGRLDLLEKRREGRIVFRLYETNAAPTLNRYITLARFYIYIYLSDLQVFTHMSNEGEVYKRRYKSSLGETRG